jgi:exodeoxyribonuclease V gamma subunit
MNGIIVHRDSRLEVLAGQLAQALDAESSENVLAPRTLVVAHPGLGRWLLRAFAQRDGLRGIAANFDLIEPWQWLERAAESALSEPAGADWQHERLRWHIHALLPDIDDAHVAAYLTGGQGAARRLQLAERLAGVFAQYLIYRPDWLADWEKGKDRGDWQAGLWRRLRKRIAQPHRAQRNAQLVAALSAKGDGERLPLHVFGVSHLPADILDALQALSAHREVHLWFPDPCRHYWADLKTPRELLRLQPDGEDLYYDIGHPLLVSLGRMAQDFFIRLDALGLELGGDEGTDGDAPATLLGTVQTSIRECDPSKVGAHASTADDASLRVHSCTTRLRELEVLKDALLGALAADPQLQHNEIVVMAPDMGAYAPLLPAVFGEAARYSDDRSNIPWHLADVHLAQTHPLLRAFAKLLDLAESRFAVSEVLDFLGVPAVARRFGLAPEDRAALETPLRRAHVAWGLDAAMKAQAGGAAVEQNSWAFGFDRVFAGLIAGADSDDILLDGILPLAGIDSTLAEALGRLHRLLDTLRGMREGFRQSRTLRDWCDWLAARVDALFRADPRDAAEQNALDALRRAIAEVGAQADAAGAEPLPWIAMREALRGQLDAVSARQPFLLGGVTFCGLVPQRSIPFKMVCLLGMNEGEFPRQGADSGLNRMLRNPRRGDRDTRREDRYLFLEALMSARARLHLSFIGRSADDGSRTNPAAPLAELLRFLDEQCGLGKDDARPWLIEEPLQPFDPKYFRENDRGLFSYAAAWAHRTGVLESAPPFIDLSTVQVEPPQSAELSFAGLRGFWRDPIKAQLRTLAGIDRGAFDTDAGADREPLQATTDRRERFEWRLAMTALESGQSALPAAMPDALSASGAFAAGAIGASAYAAARELAQPVLAMAREILGSDARRQPCAVAFECLGTRLTGTVADVFECADGRRVLLGLSLHRAAEFRDLVPFFIDWAALRLSGIAAECVFLEYPEKAKEPHDAPLAKFIRTQSVERLRAGIEALSRRALESADRPLLFASKTAWAWCEADPDARWDKARAAWEGSDHHTGERDYAPGYAKLFAREMDFLDGKSAASKAFEAACLLVAGALDPGHHVLLAELRTEAA